MKCFENSLCYVYKKGIVRTDVLFDDKIVGFCRDGKCAEYIDIPKDAVIVPGFIDEHIHGAGGADAMDASENALETIADTLLKEGTTGFLATTMTQSEEKIMNALIAAGKYISGKKESGASLLGVHLEGPFISEKHKGAQSEKYIVSPDVNTFKKYYDASGKNIKIVTVAPECEGAGELTEYLSGIGVSAFAGHTGAKYDDIKRAMERGLKGVTHTYNAQSALHHREIGTVGAALLEDGLASELIADTIHVSVPAIKLLLKSKPHEKLTLITDSIRAKGLCDGESELGGSVVIVKDGEARLKDGTLAGSVLKMNIAVKNMVEKAGASFTDAVDFATINPAKNIGLDEKIGSIEIGKNADFTVLDNEFNVVMTVRGGNILFRA